VSAVTRRALLAGAATIAGGTLLGACSGGSSDSGTPKRGGRFRAVFPGGGAGETLDPHAQVLFVDIARAQAMFDKLIVYGGDMSARPKLAQSFEPSSDATKWRFTLRDASFHDGTAVTAEDVLASLARISEPATQPRAGRIRLAGLDLRHCTAVNARTVELTLRDPDFEFPLQMAGTGMHIIPKGRTDFTRPVGSGPFAFSSFTRGRELVAKRFDDYWGGAAHIDELHILSADETARANALLGGQVEYAHEMTPTFARTHAKDPKVTIVRAPNSGMQALAMKIDRPPFDDPRVREAFMLLADRERLVDVALSGMARVGNDMFGRGYQYYPADLPQRHRDVGRARALLREAGASDLTVTLDTAEAGAGFVAAATLFADQAKEAGVTVRVRTGNKDTFFTDALKSGSLSSYRSGAMPIPDHLASRMLTDSPQNITRWKNEDFDARYRKARATSDAAKRTRHYHDLQRELHDRGGLLVWSDTEWINATSSRVKGVARAAPNTGAWARFDKVWLD